MEENLKRESSKNQKSNKILVVILSVIVLVCAALAGLYASGVLGVPGTKPTSEEAVQKASNVADKATLRELLRMDCELEITVTDDMEIKETLVVNGVKKVTSDHVLKASFQMEDGEAMLDISPKASLTIDRWNLDGNGVAQGVHVNRNATFEHAAGKMEYMGTYGVVTEGVAILSDKTEISHVGEGAFKVSIEGEMSVKGGIYKDGGNYLANVERGGVLNISGEPLFDAALNHLVYNYGETTINGGTFLNSDYRGVTNYAKMTMEYKGDKEDGHIEVGNTGNVAIYTSSTFKVSYNGVYGHDAGANVFLQSHTGARCYVEDCTFDTSKGNAVSIRGEVYFTDVDIKNAAVSGVIVQQNGVATFQGVTVDTTNGRGINVESATLLGEDIEVSNTKGIGIAAQVYDEIGPAKIELSKIHLHDILGNNVKVINGAEMSISDSSFAKSKRTSVYVDNGVIDLKNVDVLGTLDKGICVAQVQPDGHLTISGKTLITGSTMRAVGVYGGKFTMNGGIICDNSASETGAAVHLTKVKDSVGTFYMNDGTICNNRTANEKKNAGGVNVSNDTMFVMKGGKIYGNTTSGIGGGVRVAEGATFKMSGGEIYQNTSAQGGGVQVDKKATFTMTGGSIYKNETQYSGAGVYVLGSFAMSDGEIYQNKATSYGGAMNIASQTDNKTKEVTAAGTFSMTGGEIYGNRAVSGGGAIQVSGNTTAKFSGGSITSNETDGIGDGIRVSGKVTISDDFYVGNDKVALTSKDVVLRVTGNKLTKHSEKDSLLVAVADGVSTGHVVVECDDNDSAVSILTHTASGNGSYLLTQKDNNLVVNYAAADMDMNGADTIYVSNFAELKKAITSTTSKRYIILGADIEMESTITVPNGTTVYIRDDGKQRILSRNDGITSTFFNTRYGTGIYLVGTKAGNLVLDGKISSDAKATNVSSLVTAQGGTIVDGVTFRNNGTDESTKLQGAFINQIYGHIDIYDSTFTGAKAGSGAVAIRTMATGYAENCVFKDNNVVNGGGAIRLDKNSEFKVKDTVFENNSAGTSGGAVVSESGTFTAIDCDFRNNTAGNDGGVIKSNGGTAKFLDEDGEQNVLTANTSGRAGGAVWANGELEVVNYMLNENKSGLVDGTSGGGAINAEAGSATITGCTFGGNIATGDGGAIRNAATLTLENCDFKRVDDVANESVAKKGGAIYLTADGSIELKGIGEFSGNTAYQAGGAIFLNSGTIHADEEACYTFDGNIASTGGALYVQKGSYTAANFAFRNNIAEGGNRWSGGDFGGGAIVLGQGGNTEVTFTGTGEFANNQSLQNTAGGAISVMDARATLKINKDTTAEEYTCTFTGNVSQNHGGAIRIVAGTVQVERANFITNRTETNCGGAIAASNAKLIIKNSKFDGNYTGNAEGVISAKNGGAIYVDNANADVAIHNTLFHNNQAKDGGAIRITKDNQFVITDCQFTNNRAHDVEHNNSAGTGGAINMTVSGDTISVNLNGTNTFVGNKAELQGGAIFVSGAAGEYRSELTVNGTNFSGNLARGEAGAIYAGTNAVVTVTDSNFLHNEASYDYEDDTQLSARNGNGGAIYANDNAQVILLTETADTYKFEGNKAVRNATEPKTFGSICANGKSVVIYSEYYVFEDDNSDGANGATGDGIGKASDTATIKKLAAAGDYVTLKSAVANAPEGVTTEITLTGNVVIGDSRIDVNSGQDVVVKNAKGVSVEISRTSGSASNMFNVNAGGKLKFMSDSEGGSLTIDGKNIAKASMLYGRGVLELDGIVLRNGNSGNGSAVQLRNNTAQLITNNCNFESNVSTAKGGAILLTTDTGVNTYPTAILTDTDFAENKAIGSSSDNCGGAIYMSGGMVTLRGAGEYVNNAAYYAGGAIYVAGGTLNISSADVNGIQYYFAENVVTNNHGGAIHVAGGTANIYNAKFDGNRSEKNCGGAIRSGVNILIQACEFVNNIAGDKEGNVWGNGGAIYLNTSGKTYIITNSSFHGNKAKDGGAIRITAGTANITECDFYQNHSKYRNASTQGHGGAINMSGSSSAAPTVILIGNASENNVFDGNTTEGYGGAINASYGNETLTIKNYTFTNNSAEFGNATRAVHNDTTLTVDSTVVGW